MSRSLAAECRRRSVELLRRAATGAGFVASPAFDHYAAVWARDAAVACLGAHRSGDDDLVAAARRTLETLAAHQGPAGQVPNVCWPGRGYWDWGEAGAVDASAWFPVVLADHLASTGDLDAAARLWPAARRALAWLAGLDPTNTRLVDSPFAGDWMDSSLSRSGRVLHVNVLYAWAAAGAESVAAALGEDPPLDAADVGRRVNLLFWPEPDDRLVDLLDHVGYPRPPAEFGHVAAAAAYRAASRDRRHYLSHVVQAAFVDRCDVLANLFAIIAGVADARRAAAILDHLTDRGVATPFPSKCWPEPVRGGDDPAQMWRRDAEQAIPARWRNPPHCYHNAGVWPFIGAFHAAAAAHVADGRAGGLLEAVAAANQVGEWGFHEWLHGETGDPGGSALQTWNAGAFLYAADRVAAEGTGA